MALLFTITGKHIEITEAIKRHAEEKTSRLPKYYDGIDRIEVIVDGEQGCNISVEVIARGEHSRIFVVKETAPDIYRGIDTAVHKLEQQLRKKKSREHDDKHAGEVGSA